MRYVDLTDHTGAVVQSLGWAGYRTDSLIEYHGDCGPIFAGLGFDLAVIHTSVNDAAHGHTAKEYHDDLLELIAWIRAVKKNPDFPIIIAGDVHRKDFPPRIQAEYDQFPGAAFEVVAGDPNLLLLNLRRITEEDLGWGPRNTDFLIDYVHLTVPAQRDLAAIFAQELLALVPIEDPPAADLNHDGAVDGADLGLLLGAWSTPGPGDLNTDGTVDGADLGLLLAAWSQ